MNATEKQWELSPVILERMDCEERDHLRELLRIAAHELAWAIEEQCRLLLAGSTPEADHYDAVIAHGQRHHQQALSAYRKARRESRLRSLLVRPRTVGNNLTRSAQKECIR